MRLVEVGVKERAMQIPKPEVREGRRCRGLQPPRASGVDEREGGGSRRSPGRQPCSPGSAHRGKRAQPGSGLCAPAPPLPGARRLGDAGRGRPSRGRPREGVAAAGTPEAHPSPGNGC